MKKVIVVGAGPAGLMAAEVLAAAGVEVHVYDAMPSVGRKFLLAGKGGLNLTHSEPSDIFVTRYGERRPQIEPLLREVGAAQVRDWAKALGVDTFVGTSGRVFPVDMKAAPLLRAWLQRLRRPLQGAVAGPGVQFQMRHRWTGWGADASEGTRLQFVTSQGPVQASADAVVLALGGASWSRLGSDGAWVPWLQARGVAVAPLRPANCGFDVAASPASQVQQAAGVAAAHGETRREFLKELIGESPAAHPGWSGYFSSRFAGQPFKSVAIHFTDSQGHSFSRKGEFVATASGVEGSLIYAASNLLRDEIAAHGHATFHLDLLPDMTAEKVLLEVRHPRGSRSLSSHLKSRLHIEGIKAAILNELLSKAQMNDPAQLAAAIKALPITLVATRPIDEAISSAGEMLDWEAPTGGYLMTACFASGKKAGEGVLAYLGAR